MKVLFKQFLFGKIHSWGVVGQSLARALIQAGHEVHLYSTNGNNLPKEGLEPSLIGWCDEGNINKTYGKLPDKDYDLEFSYTALKNFPFNLSASPKSKKMGMWAWEFAGKNGMDTLPVGFAKGHLACDVVLSPSTFCKDIFTRGKIPVEKIKILPHGFSDHFLAADLYPLKTDKKFKFFINLASPHKRKGAEDLLEVFCSTFQKKDDVCLVAKVICKNDTKPFEFSWFNLLNFYRKKYPNHAEIITIPHTLPEADIARLYRSCNAFITASYCEGFSMTPLEALASKKIVICPNQGAHLDFCRSQNTLQFETIETRCPPNFQYWTPSPHAIMHVPVKESLREKMLQAIQEEKTLQLSFDLEFEKIRQEYSWKKITDDLLKIHGEL